MDAGHDHSYITGNERALKIAPALVSTLPLAELVGGTLTKSLAPISDAAYMFTDAAALAIALAAIQTGKRSADRQRTFGYYRFETLVTTFNALLLFRVVLHIFYEAYQRLRMPTGVQSLGMLGIATIGLVVNIVSMRVLAGGRKQSLNIEGARLEVWSDLLDLIGAIFAATVIRLTGRTWVDSAIAVLIRPWVLPHTWVLLKSSISILPEGVPEDIDLPPAEQALLTIPGVCSMRDLYVWSLTSGRTSLTVHLVSEPAVSPEHDILLVIRDWLVERFSITHITTQFELRPCAQADTVTYFRLSEPIAATTSGQPDERHGHQGHSH